SYQPDPNKPPQIEVRTPDISTFVSGYGLAQGISITPLYPSGFDSQTQILSRQTDVAIISAIGSPTISTTQETHRITLLGAPHSNTTVRTTKSVSGASTTNSIVTTTNHGWVPIAVDGTGPTDATLQITRTTEQRVIEEINAGDSNNSIEGLLTRNGNHIALIDAGRGDDIVNAGS